MTRWIPAMVLLGLTSSGVSSAQVCIGDCNADEQVAVNELVIGVNVALGRAEISACEAFDGADEVSIDMLLEAVSNSISGCGSPTPTMEPTDAATATATATVTPEPVGIFQGALTQTNGRFTYQAIIGIDGADAECDAQFPGSHACTLSELQAAESAGELVGATDTGGTPVASFWAIEPSRPDVDQCHVTVPWDYATAHTGQFADRVNLENGSGTLSALQEDTFCATQSWVGCCL